LQLIDGEKVILHELAIVYSSEQTTLSQSGSLHPCGVVYEHAKEERSNAVGLGNAPLASRKKWPSLALPHPLGKLLTLQPAAGVWL
jgi:hypothetical protein